MNTPLYGICSWTLGIDDPHELMAHIASLGLNGVQYCGHFDRYTAQQVLDAANEHQLGMILYDPFDCRPGERNGESSLDNAIRFYSQAVDYAHDLGCGLTLQGMSTWTQDCPNEESAWQRLVSLLRAISEYAGEKEIALCYELCNLYEVPLIHTAEDYQRLIEESGCHEVGILLDSFHMNIGEHDPLQTLARFASRNAVFHISDSNREGIGRGHLDFATWHQTLYANGFDGPCVLEFVLSETPVNVPPRHPREMSEFDEMVRESLAIWQSYGLPDESRVQS